VTLVRVHLLLHLAAHPTPTGLRCILTHAWRPQISFLDVTKTPTRQLIRSTCLYESSAAKDASGSQERKLQTHEPQSAFQGFMEVSQLVDILRRSLLNLRACLGWLEETKVHASTLHTAQNHRPDTSVLSVLWTRIQHSTSTSPQGTSGEFAGNQVLGWLLYIVCGEEKQQRNIGRMVGYFRVG